MLTQHIHATNNGGVAPSFEALFHYNLAFGHIESWSCVISFSFSLLIKCPCLLLAYLLFILMYMLCLSINS